MPIVTLPVQLFFQKREYKVGTITFDLILSEQHNFNNQVADHNVEDGSVISDHIKNELENGSLTGLITNYSIKTFGVTTNRAQDAFETLIDLWKSRTLITIVTVMRVYENVAITSCNVSRSSSTGEAIELNISFKKLRVVKLLQALLTVSIKLNGGMSPDINKQAAPNQNVGTQQAGL